MFSANSHTFAVCAYKESEYLEQCVASLKNQTVKSKIIMCTATDNDKIRAVAKKYDLELFVNSNKPSICGDWNFAMSSCDTELVTLAHQDDVYEPDYLENAIKALNLATDPIMFFSSYSELRNGQKVYSNKLLNIKKFMLSPLKIKAFWKSKFIRRRILALGNAICCPSVTYVIAKTGKEPFCSTMKSNLDWEQWEVFSKLKGSFVYFAKPLMSHRIHEESTTSAIIADNTRTKEDYEIYRKFWPDFIAKFLTKQYQKSEKSNESK
ncbi:MAG: glycosyltransferase family 2 protein [Clostridia bacterium]|nr:glycosyltransferase family 2 protein [Clostridia bacterium]